MGQRTEDNVIKLFTDFIYGWALYAGVLVPDRPLQQVDLLEGVLQPYLQTKDLAVKAWQGKAVHLNRPMNKLWPLKVL